MRTPWLAARLLCKVPTEAQGAAKLLLQHLEKVPAAQKTSFETCLWSNDHVQTRLREFATADPAVTLWQKAGRFRDLFMLLAPQFLLAPDHILDCERQHARWQWLCETKRAMKLPALNAFLKCSSWLEKHEGQFPAPAELAEHLEAARLQIRWDLEALDKEDEEVASGWRQEALWAPRFNLSSEDHHLLAPVDRDPPKRLVELGGG